LSPVDQIISSWKGFVAAKVHYQRLSAVLKNISDEPERKEFPSPEGNLQVKNLTVTPPGAKSPVLRNVSFDVPAGSVVGIVGASAAGKSTLARALMNIWPIESGVILLDGTDIRAWNKHDLGPHVGYLPQDIELFEGSISENISRFEEVDPEKVVLASKTAGVHEMVLQLPEGYDTVIGGDGMNLSGGQRQRIGLARALYGIPRLIVLDEPNSNLDEIGERALSVALRKLKEAGSTIFVVSHRQSVLTSVDRLLVMSDGTVSVYGERDSVIAQLAKQKIGAQQRPASTDTVTPRTPPAPAPIA
jgi:ATP-binding cassette subfamily C protein EexD